MQTLLPFFAAMVIAIVLLNMWATKLKIAYPILLVLAGLTLSLIPGLPSVDIEPNIIFFIFLPPLLFEAAWSASFKEMRKWWRIIFSFAFLVVFFTALSVAVVANYFIPGFSLALGFLLGGIVSPPDAVSTGAITKFVPIPKSFQAILEGESLMNDASSLIIFRFALIAIGTGQFIWQEAAISFLWMAIGGAAIGLFIAWIFIQAHKRLPIDAPSNIALTLIEPFLMYWAAEEFHSSGVLAVVFGGLLLSQKRLTILDSASRIRGFSVWESYVFILNGFVFLIIGLELPTIVEGMNANGNSIGKGIQYGLLVTAILIGARIISSYTAMIATYIFRPNIITRNKNHIRKQLLMPLLLGWTGMRGVVSLAAALAIPLTLTDGTTPFPYRNLILFITFITILLTLLLQGLTLPIIIKYFKIFNTPLHEESQKTDRKRMKQGLERHVLQFLKTKYSDRNEGHKGIQKLITHWEERTEAQDDSWMNEETKEIYYEMLETQRQYLIELNKDPDFDEDLIRNQIFQIDLEEERLRVN